LKRLQLDPWILAALLLFGLAWHGGLHAWQVFAASLGIALLWWTAPRRWSMERPFLLGLVVVITWQALASVQSQVSLEQSAWLLTLLVLAQTLRRQPRPSLRSLNWVVGLSALAALALFARSAWVLHQDPTKAWVGTELVAVATHWFFPNQNLLVGGVLIPGLLVGSAWIYRGLRAGRGEPARTDLWGWAAWGLISAGIAYAGSRGGLLALAGAGAWWLARAYRHDGASRRLALIAVLLATTLGLSWKSPLAGLQRRAAANAVPQTQDSFRYQRLKFWKASFLASAQRPWLGWGQGAFAEAIERQDTGAELSPRDPIARYRLHLFHAHNEVLETAVELGWPVALLLSALLLAFFWMRWHSSDGEPLHWALEAFLAGLAVHAMVDMPLRPAFLQLAGALTLAWLWPKAEEADERGAPAAPSALALALAVLLSLGTAMHWTLHEPRADLTIEDHVQRRPYDPLGWLALAQRAYALGEPQAMRAYLDHALWLEPNFVDAWTLRLQLAKAQRDAASIQLATSELKRINGLVIPADQAQDPYCLRLLNRKTPLSDSGKKP
jgi:O-antigen ligase